MAPLSKFLQAVGADKLIEASSRALNQAEYTAFVSALAIFFGNKGKIEDRELEYAGYHPSNIPWMGGFGKADLIRDINLAFQNYSTSPSTQRLVCFDNLRKIKTADRAKIILGSVCDCAAMDNNFDDTEKAITYQIADALGVIETEAMQIIGSPRAGTGTAYGKVTPLPSQTTQAPSAPASMASKPKRPWE